MNYIPYAFCGFLLVAPLISHSLFYLLWSISVVLLALLAVAIEAYRARTRVIAKDIVNEIVNAAVASGKLPLDL
jgi:hypothetical protein